MAHDLTRLAKDLAGLARHIPAPGRQVTNFHDALQQMSAKLSTPAAAFVTADILQKTAYEHLLAHALALVPVFPLTAARFKALTESAHSDLPALSHRLGDWVRQLLALRQAVLAGPKRYAGLEQDVARLMPADFLTRTPHTRLAHLHRQALHVQRVLPANARSPANED
jgi:ATP-dependent helicase HrpA